GWIGCWVGLGYTLFGGGRRDYECMSSRHCNMFTSGVPQEVVARLRSCPKWLVHNSGTEAENRGTRKISEPRPVREHPPENGLWRIWLFRYGTIVTKNRRSLFRLVDYGHLYLLLRYTLGT
ncbi:unnamed protein product, partial [Ectocarpus sp. 13 AM-2016]